MAKMMKALFELGSIYATPGAIDACRDASQDLMELMNRHLAGDWGDLDEHDKEANDLAVHEGDLRILSAYQLSTGIKIWIITEADRSVSTFLLPSEY